MGIEVNEVFRDWGGLSLRQWPGVLSADAERAHQELWCRTAGGGELLAWAAVPALVLEVFGERGWRWNGFYLRRSDDLLELGAAAGPPVCHSLERQGGPFASGMCFDALLLGQAVVARDVRSWPGYVSCDAESGLRTVAGLVCPLRGPGGTPVGVWDLDATAPLEPGEPWLMDRYFSTLSALRPPALRDLEP